MLRVSVTYVAAEVSPLISDWLSAAARSLLATFIDVDRVPLHSTGFTLFCHVYFPRDAEVLSASNLQNLKVPLYKCKSSIRSLFCYILFQLLRDVFVSLAAKCLTMFTYVANFVCLLFWCGAGHDLSKL